MPKQLDSFDCAEVKPKPSKAVPEADIYAALENGATLVISVSGGKDSDAMTRKLMAQRREHGWTGKVMLFHNDLGRAEWADTLPYVHRQADFWNLELVVAHRELRGVRFDLFDEIEARRARLDEKGEQHKPHWPSSAARYCTKHQKEQVCDTWIRSAFPRDATVVVAMGLRDQESPARAKKPDAWMRDSYAPTLNRHVYSWLPIRKLTLEQVWTIIGYGVGSLKLYQRDYAKALAEGDDAAIALMESRWRAHPAYLRGNERLSCSHCVLASVNDLMNGAEHNPDTYRYLTRMEMTSGFTFTQKVALCSLRPDLLDADVHAWAVEKGYIA